MHGNEVSVGIVFDSQPVWFFHRYRRSDHHRRLLSNKWHYSSFDNSWISGLFLLGNNLTLLVFSVVFISVHQLILLHLSPHEPEDATLSSLLLIRAIHLGCRCCSFLSHFFPSFPYLFTALLVGAVSAELGQKLLRLQMLCELLKGYARLLIMMDFRK